MPADTELELRQKVDAVAAAITEYLTWHPKAADTVAGIEAWWLHSGEPRAVVEQALAVLVERGVVEARATHDKGEIIYAGVRRQDTEHAAEHP
jgi:hypothetical protein